jgi:hypothetical protein
MFTKFLVRDLEEESDFMLEFDMLVLSGEVSVSAVHFISRGVLIVGVGVVPLSLQLITKPEMAINITIRFFISFSHFYFNSLLTT